MRGQGKGCWVHRAECIELEAAFCRGRATGACLAFKGKAKGKSGKCRGSQMQVPSGPGQSFSTEAKKSASPIPMPHSRLPLPRGRSDFMRWPLLPPHHFLFLFVVLCNFSCLISRAIALLRVVTSDHSWLASHCY